MAFIAVVRVNRQRIGRLEKGKKIGVEEESDTDDELFQQLRRPRGRARARGYQRLTRDALLSLDEAEKGMGVGPQVGV